VLSPLLLLSLLLPLLLLNSGCSSFREIIPLEVKTVEVERKIPVQKRPRPVAMNDIYFYVVTLDTYQEFKSRFVKENGDLLFYAMSVRDYETLALNMSEIKRFLQQQKQIIIYYEKAVKPKEKKAEKDQK
jgi:hypothetical protein